MFTKNKFLHFLSKDFLVVLAHEKAKDVNMLNAK